MFTWQAGSKPLCLLFTVLTLTRGPMEAAWAHPKRDAAPLEEPATEAQFRDAIHDIDELGRTLWTSLSNYRKHLQTALMQLGYGPYHPLFRTSLNGFEQDQIDLEDLDQYKMGMFAYTMQDSGTLLNPDPFRDWQEVEFHLQNFEKRLDTARSLVARTNIFEVRGRNIPVARLRRLRKEWVSAAELATSAYEHAMAVRAVKFENGEIVPAAANVRRIIGAGRYGVICAFNVCTMQSTSENGEPGTIPLVH